MPSSLLACECCPSVIQGLLTRSLARLAQLYVSLLTLFGGMGRKLTACVSGKCGKLCREVAGFFTQGRSA